MKEERFELQPYGVRYICDCGDEMLPTGTMLMTDPPKFPHKCQSCDSTITLNEKYPTVKWEIPTRKTE